MLKKSFIILVFLIGIGCMMSKSDDSLKEYRKKRDFSESPEPAGKKKRAAKSSKKTRSSTKTTDSKSKDIFVIQKHDASHLHYDLRLEINGALKSWAIPKGPSTDPHDKRLAIETEDHPMEYATFEGVIPEGHYGAGPVIVWDNGTFDNIKEKDGKLIPLNQCYKNGQIEVNLHGKKLQGGYALIRTASNNEDKKKWLFIKMNDEYADARRNPVASQPESVISGKVIEKKPYFAKASKGKSKKKVSTPKSKLKK